MPAYIQVVGEITLNTYNKIYDFVLEKQFFNVKYTNDATQVELSPNKIKLSRLEDYRFLEFETFLSNYNIPFVSVYADIVNYGLWEPQSLVNGDFIKKYTKYSCNIKFLDKIAFQALSVSGHNIITEINNLKDNGAVGYTDVRFFFDKEDLSIPLLIQYIEKHNDRTLKNAINISRTEQLKKHFINKFELIDTTFYTDDIKEEENKDVQK